MDELDRHRSFTHGGGASFARPGADVAGREHAGNIGLEQLVRARCRPGEDEAVVVAGHGLVEPLGARKSRSDSTISRR